MIKGYFYDEEQFRNYWCIGIKNIETGVIKRFEIFLYGDIIINDLVEFYDYLDFMIKHKGTCYQIGFNNINYDYPKEHYMIANRNLLLNCTTAELLEKLYDKTQELINSTFNKEKNRGIPEWKHWISQIDLMSVFHFTNKAKMVSLKGLEIAMGMDLVEDMPLKFSDIVIPDNLDNIRNYNTNDLIATEQFYNIAIGKTDNPLYKGQNKLQLRKELGEKYKIDLINKNDVAIGKEIVIHKVANTLNIDIKELRKLRTYRKEVHLKDTIPSFISYNTPEMNSVLKYYKNTIITNSDVEEIKS